MIKPIATHVGSRLIAFITLDIKRVLRLSTKTC